MDGRWLTRSSSALWQVLFFILLGVHIQTPSSPKKPGGGDGFVADNPNMEQVYMIPGASHRSNLAWPDIGQSWPVPQSSQFPQEFKYLLNRKSSLFSGEDVAIKGFSVYVCEREKRSHRGQSFATLWSLENTCVKCQWQFLGVVGIYSQTRRWIRKTDGMNLLNPQCCGEKWWADWEDGLAIVFDVKKFHLYVWGFLFCVFHCTFICSELWIVF